MKTAWQKFYSFFGFWTYTLVEPQPNGDMNEYTVLYWCAFPWFRYYRKFDVVRWFNRSYSGYVNKW